MLQEITLFVSKHSLLSLSWIALFITVIGITLNNCFSKVKEISRTEAVRLINKENAIVVDTRSRDDFLKGHLANAINLTVSEIKSGNLGDLEKHKTKPIILVCANDMASREPAENLNKFDFDNIMKMKEGIEGWIGANLPLVREE